MATTAPQAGIGQSDTFPEGQCVFIDVNQDKGRVVPEADKEQLAANAVSNDSVKQEGEPAPKKAPPLFIKAAVGSLILSIVFYVFLFIYLGASSNQLAYTQNLQVAVMSFDSGMIGQAVLGFAGAVHSGNGLPSLQVITTPTSIDDMRNRVGNAEFWGAVLVQTDATSKLNAAFAAADGTFNPASAIQFIYDESRFPTTVASRISGPVRGLLTAFCQNFSATFVQKMGANPKISAVATSAPKLLSQPLWFTETNLHPATVQVATFGLTVGMILLVVFSWASWAATYGMTEPPTPPATHGGMVALQASRVCVALWITFCVTLSFTLIWQALGADFPSGGAWVGFWLLHWLHMFNYAMTLSVATNLLTFPKAPMALIFIIVFNASGAFNELSLTTPFYQWGWAMPMAHAVMASRTLVYNGRDTLGINVGALAIWATFMFCLSFLTLPRPKPSTSASSSSAPTAAAAGGGQRAAP